MNAAIITVCVSASVWFLTNTALTLYKESKKTKDEKSADTKDADFKITHV